jgi:hypothetical protein
LRLVELEARVALEDLRRVALAEVAQEIRLPGRAREELLVDGGVVEPGHRARVDVEGARHENEVGALQRAVAQRRGLGVRFLLLAGVGVLHRRVVREGARQQLVEHRVVRDDRGDRRDLDLGLVARAEMRLEPLLAWLRGIRCARLRVAGRGSSHQIPDRAELRIGHLARKAVVGARLRRWYRGTRLTIAGSLPEG